MEPPKILTADVVLYSSTALCVQLKIQRLLQTFNKDNENSFMTAFLFCFVVLGFFFSIFPSPDQELNPSVLPAAHNTGGSLPDLTNIQFPPPLSTPLDPDDTVAFPSLSSSNSTGSLTTNLTHLGISVASHGNNREKNKFLKIYHLNI